MRVASSTRLFVAALVIGIGMCSLLAGKANAQQPPNCAPWINQVSWTGTISLQGTGQVVRGDGSTEKIDQSATVSFTTDNPAGDGCFTGIPLNWIAGVGGIKSYSVTINDEVDTPVLKCGVRVDTFKVLNGTYPENAELVIDPFAGTYQVNMNTAVNALKFDTTLCDGSKQPTFIWDSFLYGPRRPYLVSGIKLPSSGLTLSGSVSYQDVGGFELINDPPVSWTITWNLVPTPLNLDLIVSIPNYETWRPAGGKTEKDAGVDPVSGLHFLEVDAKLVNKDTGAPSTVMPEKLTYSLINPSRESGVALNWPASSAASGSPDITFDDVINPLANLSSENTVADFLPVDPSRSTAYLVSHDWGGWATLTVVATVNGAKINGHFQGDTKTDILLPKRQANSFIADSWKTANNISLQTPDNDDSENDPVGNGQTGDGFTLYEEYRGFYMGCIRNGGPVVPEKNPSSACKHVEGDPKKKDLFVSSFLLTPGELGIEKFRAVTGLNVHYRGLSRSEMAPDRIINFNHTQGPHLQNSLTSGQHALYIHWKKGVEASEAVGGPGFPRDIKEINIATAPSILRPESGGAPGDNYFTATVAHELAHSVNVWHHGEWDLGNVTWYADKNGQVWETATPAKDQNASGGVPVTVLLNETDDPKSGITYTPYELGLLQACAQDNDNCPPLPRGVVIDVGNHLCAGTVKQGDQHSGDQDCLMRYDAADAYIPLGFPKVRYQVSEVTGYQLTDVVKGTAVNDAATHQTGIGPLSRYGDADSTDNRGECTKQVDVNDLHAAISRKSTQACPAP